MRCLDLAHLIQLTRYTRKSIICICIL